eukprot:gnl/TRDRNA2_/TRDRNA2_84118_c0_seq1.p2 gnl/TRDRNA2_/TRDRNA2_84118_c0~~gnl/TRDRNA2_/TRDRNA2_84118_c0_seq1.p2  ORF type:complete len:172 (+),score=46.36 gnl/TRDRNA2_/TRDRNA2_84118_c0_seq1:74-589(+)
MAQGGAMLAVFAICALLEGSAARRLGEAPAGGDASALAPLLEMAPVLVATMGTERAKLKKDIGQANRLEEESRSTYAAQLDEQSRWSKGWQANATLKAQADKWKKSRDRQHDSYHDMLTEAHKGMHKIDKSEHALQDLQAGKNLTEGQMKALMTVMQDAQAQASGDSSDSA